MQTLFETQLFQIVQAIGGDIVILHHKTLDDKKILIDKVASDFLSYYTENLHIIPPSAIPQAMDDLCGHYFRQVMPVHALPMPLHTN